MAKAKTLRQLHKIFWKIFSEYNRRKFADRNGYVACCSCGTIHHYKNMDCGHYISRIFLYTKYLDINCQSQCKRCNAFLQGNAVGYRQFLVGKYGEEEVVKLEDSRHYPASYTKDGLLLKIKEYKEKIIKLDRPSGGLSNFVKKRARNSRLRKFNLSYRRENDR